MTDQQPPVIENGPIKITKHGKKLLAEFKCWSADRLKRKASVTIWGDSRDDLKRKVSEFLDRDDLPEFLNN